MCSGTNHEWPQLLHFCPQKRASRTRFHALRLSRTRKLRFGREKKLGKKLHMKLKNLKLYMENVTIMEQNEKLRKQAIKLHQENLALISQINQKR